MMLDFPAAVRRAVVDFAGVSALSVTAETEFDDLEMDSLDVTELVIELEEKLGVIIGGAPLNIRTVGELTRCLEAASPCPTTATKTKIRGHSTSCGHRRPSDCCERSSSRC